MDKNTTAAYHKTPEKTGNRYHFRCAVTGAQFSTVQTYQAATPRQEPLLAWQTEGRNHFNQCQRCGRWVFDVAYNPEVLECIACAPFECEARYCKFCGARVPAERRTCPTCGRPLYYEGVDPHDPEAQI